MRRPSSDSLVVGCVASIAMLLVAQPSVGQATAASQNIPASLHGDSLGDGGPAIRARLVTPVGLARDAQGNIYITERGAHRVRRVDAQTGIITTFAGTGEAGYSGDGGPASRARLTQPDGIVIDAQGNVIIADTFNDRVRRVDVRTGIISTIAGTGEAGFSGDGGPATQARFDGPFGLALDPSGNLYITDTENHRIRRVDARTGMVTTVAGNGVWDFAGDGGPARDASFARPHLVLAEGDTALLIGDSFNFRIRRIDLRTGIIRTIAGSGERGSGGDGGPATSAAITYMGGLAFLPNGDLLVTSLAEHRIRRIDRRTGIMSAVAGTGRWTFDGDGGRATRASLHLPLQMLVDSTGTILFTDLWNGRIRRIDGRSGQITTVVGSALSPSTPAVGWHFHYHRDSLRKVLDEPVRYAMDGTAQVRVTRNVLYGARDSRYRRFDVYEPPTGGSHPAVIVVPGRNDSEIRLKDTGGFEAWGRLIAASGLVAIVMDHSLGTQGRSLTRASDDLAAALDYVKRNAVSLRIDARRVCAIAFATATPLLTPLLTSSASGVQCAIGYYPHVDLTRADAASWLLESREARQQYSLTPVLAQSRTPTLLVRAGREQPAVNSALDSLLVRLSNRAGLTVVGNPEGEVGFERTRADSATRAVVRATLCFLQRNAGVPETQCAASGARGVDQGRGFAVGVTGLPTLASAPRRRSASRDSVTTGCNSGSAFAHALATSE